MHAKIGKNAKKILQGIDVIKYSKLINDLYNLEEPNSSLIAEKEKKVLEKVESLIKKYFPGVLKSYKIVLSTIDYDFLNGSEYCINLRKKS